MHENQQTVESTKAGDETPSRKSGLRAGRAGEHSKDALKAVLGPEDGRRLEELLDRLREEEAVEQQRMEEEQRLARDQRQAQQEERNRAQREADWERFMQRELRELRLRKEGQLASLLGEPRPGEPAAALRRLAEEDERQAEQGLVALMSGGELRYKRLDQLSPQDMPTRLAAERLRTTWLKKRQDGWLAQGEGSL